MGRRDFKGYYAALDLRPGATDQEIARAKRAFNELYHSDRLAHMSEQARAIAADKVRAANEAAQALLDPANRAARDAWISDSRHTEEASRPRDKRNDQADAAPPPDPGWAGQPRAGAATGQRGRTSSWRLTVIGLSLGGLLGATGMVIRVGLERKEVGDIATVTPAAGDTVQSASAPEHLERRPSPPSLATTVIDSVLVLPGDGRWTQPVAGGGSSFRVTFVPESEAAYYRVRTDGQREYVLLDEPGFQKITEPAESYRFSSMTGHPVRLRFSRWRVDATPGKAIHQMAIQVPPDGSWSRRVYLGDMSVRWDADRTVGYEGRDDRWRIMHFLPSVSSVFFERYPQWIQFRSTDSLPLTLTVRYTAR
jgi:hypothetical protein